jgi:cytochrome c-type biogenesis protein CcmH
MSRRIALAAALVLALVAPRVLAVEPDEMLPDAAQEARAQALSKELRCVVCQNQNIDDSAAPIARDMRLLVRERIKAGDTDAQAKAFLVARYGNFVLLKPPFQADTLILWFGPFIILALAGAGLFAIARSGAPDDEGEAAQSENGDLE